jgi:hypothetical protein
MATYGANSKEGETGLQQHNQAATVGEPVAFD